MILKCSIFLIFALYMLYITIIATSIPTKVLFALTGIVVAAIMLLYEYLRSLYDNMIFALNIHGNLESALTYKAKLQKYDYFKGFSKSIVLFDVFTLLDQGEIEQCLQVIEKESKFFSSSLDYLFIKYYYRLKCYFFLNNRNKMKESYTKITQLRHAKVKGQKISKLFSWDEIDGLHFYAEKDFTKALTALNGVNTSRMNPRETTYLNAELTMTYLKNNQPALALQAFDKARQAPSSIQLDKLNEAFRTL